MRNTTQFISVKALIIAIIVMGHVAHAQLVLPLEGPLCPATKQTNTRLPADDSSGSGGGFLTGFTQILSEKLSEFLSELFDMGFQTGASNFDLITLDGSELGLDPFMVSSVVLGINRQVEKNPFPTSEDDLFLVKDTIRVGIHLGLGFVASGDVGLIREYTLVYPKPKFGQALFANKFIFNPFLPYKVLKNKLPEKYTLMTDSYLEGRGKIDLGSQIFVSIGSELSLSRIRLKRQLISQKSKDLVNVYDDYSVYTQLAQSIYLKLGLLKIPMFDHAHQKGKLERTYYELKLNQPGVPDPEDALDLLIKKQDVSLLRLIGREKVIKDEFKQHSYRFTLFGLFTNKYISRVDDITENHSPDDPHKEDLIRRYQVESIKLESWTLGYKGEKNQSHVVTMMEVDADNKARSPKMEITLNTYDDQVKNEELKSWYLPLADIIAGKKNFIPYKTFRDINLKDYKKFHMNSSIHIYEAGIKKILNSDEDKIWKMWEKITGKSKRFWISKSKSRPTVSRRIQSRTTIVDVKMAKNMVKFIKLLQRSNAEKGLDKWHAFGNAVRQLVYISRQTFNMAFFELISSLAGSENLFSYVQMYLPGGEDNKQDIWLEEKSGFQKPDNNIYHKFNLERPSDFYYLFEPLFRVSPSL